jgi:arsenate reductase-like glutaredoxin family protein
MSDEIDDEILDAEMTDDALEKTMKKAESEAARILNQSSDLLKSLRKDTAKQEEEKKEEGESASVSENIE